MKRKAKSKPINRHQVREELQRRILRGEYPPGAQLRQMHLATEFGVAQSVVREVLQELDYHGLVRSVENLGVFVRELGKKELLDAYRVREMFEGLAARLCCFHASRADVQWLEKIAGEIHDSAVKGKPAEERGELEQRFHFRFVELSGNETLRRLSYGYRFLGNLVITGRDRDEILREHLAIVRAVADNDPDAAERLAREHVGLSAKSIEEATDELFISGDLRPLQD
jgi:DNA-binding GntR family transcriptional regulator